jgi:hypothetical protein
VAPTFADPGRVAPETGLRPARGGFVPIPTTRQTTGSTRSPGGPVTRPSARATYFWLMGSCVALIVLAWNVVRFWSVPVAVGMSVVAALIPPVATMLAGRGRGGG